MVLSDGDIKKAVAVGKIKIEPWDPEMVQPASVDLHLGDNFQVFDRHSQTIIDIKKREVMKMRKIVVEPGTPFIIHPGEFLLGTTIERVTVPVDMVGRLEGKSSLGRIGLVIHVTAGFFDPGFSGQCTLEIVNLNTVPIAIYAGMKICQFSFSMLTTPAQKPYGHKDLGSHYHGQVGATVANLSGVMKK